MTFMIFKFYLQSSEFEFFIRRLKNVAGTRTATTPNKTAMEMIQYKNEASKN